MNPAQYKRQNTEWKKWLGKKGKVVVSTFVQVTSTDKKELLPYSYVLVDFGNEKKEFMGVDHNAFEENDEVQCVARIVENSSKNGLIEYGIKVIKI